VFLKHALITRVLVVGGRWLKGAVHSIAERPHQQCYVIIHGAELHGYGKKILDGD
jgi:hypothetical protein